MNIANNSTQRLFFMLLMLMPLQLIKAEGFVMPENNIAQREEHIQQLVLSNSQIKSRLEHQLVNYWLGNNIDQYLAFGDNDDDDVAKKSSKRLKLRLNRHRLILQYRYYFR